MGALPEATQLEIETVAPRTVTQGTGVGLPAQRDRHLCGRGTVAGEAFLHLAQSAAPAGATKVKQRHLQVFLA